MTQRTIGVLLNENHSKLHKKNNSTNKTDVIQIDDTWSLEVFDLEDYRPENNRGKRFFLVVINKLSIFVEQFHKKIKKMLNQ